MLYAFALFVCTAAVVESLWLGLPLVAWLDESANTYGIWSLQVMDALWKNYETGVGPINGISAMPSMHVGTSVLFAILASLPASAGWAGCWRSSRR